MASPKLLRGRISQIGALFTISTVTHDRVPYFLDLELATAAISEINRCADEDRLENLAWVVMPDHIHWMFALRNGRLGSCPQAFKSRSGRTINSLSGTSGPIWQSGFYDHRLRDEDDVLQQARYLVSNPIRNGLVSQLEDYPHWWCRWIRTRADL